MNRKKPNILFIMADQLIADKIGAYGCKYAITPNLDRLIESGAKFNSAYTSCPICAPARMSMLTGKYVSEIECYDNSAVLKADEPTYNHYLSTAGYDTVLSGKMHMIGPDQKHGYEKRLLTNVYPSDFHWLAQRKKGISYKDLHPKPIAIDYLGENTGPRQWSMELDYDEEAVFKAVKYLATKCTRPSGTAQKPLPERDERPFFLHVSLNHPHEPFHNLKKYYDMYENINIPVPDYPENLFETYSSMDKELADFHGSRRVDLMDEQSLKKLHRSYMASVTYFDSKVGELLQALQDFGLEDDTVILFTSDHGDMLGQRGMVQKRRFYDSSCRIPLSITFPTKYQKIEGGRSYDDVVSICDILPTLLELAETESEIEVDGVSLFSVIRGENNPNRAVFAEQHSEGVSTANFMVRKKNYKFNLLGKGDCQLFDLQNDPEEWNNLAGKPEFIDIENELRNEILDRFDPEEIDRKAELSVLKRSVIKSAHETVGGIGWNYRPWEDIDHIYWRSEEY